MHIKAGNLFVAFIFLIGASCAMGDDAVIRIQPLNDAVMAGQLTTFKVGPAAPENQAIEWRFGDGLIGKGAQTNHIFEKPGLYRVRMITSLDGNPTVSEAIVRAHTSETLHLPQVVLDTDQKNEQDDQYYFSYGLFSQLDILGVNSIHHGGGQEPMNYGEILNVLNLARQSGLPNERIPLVFRGANERLTRPESGRWSDTQPIVTAASKAMVAAARGASPDNPVWIVPVGPGTNVASAILMARAEGLDLKMRMRVMWLGSADAGIRDGFNAMNDPWSMVVVSLSGVETWVISESVGARVAIDKTVDGNLYPDNPLCQYLKAITPPVNKPLFDPSCLSAIISMRLNKDWVKRWDDVTVGGETGVDWVPVKGEATVHVIRDIDEQAMRHDLFETLADRPTQLIGVPSRVASGILR